MIYRWKMNLLLTTVIVSYRQTVRAYPQGGGAYRVSKENLGVLAGLTADSCIMFTAHDAYMRDFKLMVPRDCSASEEEAENRHALEHMANTCKAEIGLSSAIDFARLRQAA